MYILFLAAMLYGKCMASGDQYQPVVYLAKHLPFLPRVDLLTLKCLFFLVDCVLNTLLKGVVELIKKFILLTQI